MEQWTVYPPMVRFSIAEDDQRPLAEVARVAVIARYGSTYGEQVAFTAIEPANAAARAVVRGGR